MGTKSTMNLHQVQINRLLICLCIIFRDYTYNHKKIHRLKIHLHNLVKIPEDGVCSKILRRVKPQIYPFLSVKAISKNIGLKYVRLPVHISKKLKIYFIMIRLIRCKLQSHRHSYLYFSNSEFLGDMSQCPSCDFISNMHMLA